MQLTIGQDCELFLQKDGQFISAHGAIPGTKHNPYPVKCGAVQVDGMALEINTKPAKTYEQFKNNINTVLFRLSQMIPNDCEMVFTPTATFTQEHMEEQPFEAVRLGCDPDYNAYTGAENPQPDGTGLMRTASGHIHVGWTEGMDVKDPLWIDSCAVMAREMDVFLGLPSLLEDKDHKRRILYGKAGAFRPKPYGMEYRVLSNYWLNSDYFMSWIFNRTHRCYNGLKHKPINLENIIGEPMDVQEIINKRHYNLAQKIVKRLSLI